MKVKGLNKKVMSKLKFLGNSFEKHRKKTTTN